MYHRLEATGRLGTDARWRIGWFAPFLLLAIGCDPPPRPLVEQAEPTRPAATVERVEPPVRSGLPRGAALQLAKEAPFDLWDAYFLNGEQVGYSHIHAVPTADATEIEYRVTERMKLRRGASILDQHLQQTSIETLDGQLRRFEAELDINGGRSSTRGTVRGDELVITVERDGQTQERRIAWDASIGGLLAMQQSLKESPLVVGERRRIRALAPMFYEVGQLDLRGLGTAAVPLLSGATERLQEVESISSIGGNPLLKMHLWVDDRGDVLKSYAPSLGLSIFRTDEATATRFATPEIDVMIQSRVKLDQPLSRPRQLQQSVFTVRTKDPEMAARFLKDAPGQRVEPELEDAWRVSVVQGVDRAFDSAPPNDGDRLAGPLIQSDDRRVQQLAALAEAPADQDAEPAELAEELARIVYTTIGEKNLGSGFESAAEVAASREGDCTEHAVLLAAMCRAREIPARVAAGLVYVDSPEGPAMAFHMWTLAWVDGGWLPLDGTMQDGVAAADRITLVHDNLAGGSEYAMVAPVMQSLGQLEVAVESTGYTKNKSAATR